MNLKDRTTFQTDAGTAESHSSQNSDLVIWQGRVKAKDLTYKLTHCPPQFWWFISGLLALLVVLGYWRALRIGFLSDDHLMLTFAQNAPIDGSVFAVNPVRWLLFHRPFVLFIWQLMYTAWDMNPLPYHIFSLLLHALNSLLIVRLVLLFAPNRILTAVGAGLIFALFPLNVEPVIWLSSWFDLFALVGMLGTLICLIFWWRGGGAGWFLLSLVVYQLAIWSKESAFVLPILVLCIGILLRPRPAIGRILVSCIPYGVLVGFNLLQRYRVWGSIGGYEDAPNNVLDFAYDHLIHISEVFIAPLNRLVFPAHVIQIAGLITGAILVFGLLITGRQRLTLLGFSWIVVTLAPVINLLPIGADLQNARLVSRTGLNVHKMPG